MSKVSALAVPVPAAVEQQAITAQVEHTFSVIDAVEAQINASLARAARLRQAILKRAFEGRLTPRDTIDAAEP